MTRNMFQPRWRRVLRLAGVRPRKAHTLRHTFASQLIQNGENLAYVRDQLGHHSIKLTVDVYGHLLPGDKTAVDRLDGPTVRNPPATGPGDRPHDPVIGGPLSPGDPEHFLLLALEPGTEVAGDLLGAREPHAPAVRPRAEPPRQLDRRAEAHRLGDAEAADPRELLHLPVGERREGAEGGEERLSLIERRLAGAAGSQEQREALGVAERVGALREEALSRPVLGRPLADRRTLAVHVRIAEQRRCQDARARVESRDRRALGSRARRGRRDARIERSTDPDSMASRALGAPRGADSGGGSASPEAPPRSGRSAARRPRPGSARARCGPGAAARPAPPTRSQ